MCCNHIIEAKRPDVVVVEKKGKKCMIINIVAPWGNRIHEKEQEKIDNTEDPEREIARL